MARAHHVALAIAALALAACTPGGVASGGIAGASGSGSAPAIINVSLTAYPAASLGAGTAGGFAPLSTTLAVGSTFRFMNTDTFAHTATAIPNVGTFPAASPFTASAQSQSGAMLSGAWSSGTLQAGAASQAILVDKPGTYLFGCFFHYGAPMRGEIVAL